MAAADHPPTPDTLTALREAEAAEQAAEAARHSYEVQRESFLQALVKAALPESFDLDAVSVFSDALDALDRTLGQPTADRLVEARKATNRALEAHHFAALRDEDFMWTFCPKMTAHLNTCEVDFCEVCLAFANGADDYEQAVQAAAEVNA